MTKSFSSYALYLLITVLVLCLYLGDFTGLKKLQWKIDDLMYTFRGEKTIASDIVMVNIDDASCRALGNWPWSYARVADLVATCNSGRPRAMLVSLDLPSRASEDTSGNTQTLANQISWAENVVLTYDIALAEYSHQRMSKPEYLYRNSLQTNSDLGILDEGAALNVRSPFLPSGVIVQYADGLGFSYFEYDQDRRIRWAPLLANYDGYYYPSAPLLAAAMFAGFGSNDITIEGSRAIKFGRCSIPTDDGGRVFVNFSNAHTTFPEYSAVDLLKERVDLADLKDKLVIVGVTVYGASDAFNTPVAPAMSRSELMANVVENIIHNNYVKRLDFSVGINLLILVGFGLFCAVILPRVTLLYRLIILFVCLFILANLSFILFNSYGTLMNSLYLGLEIFLFILAAPLLEDSKTERFNFDFLSFFGRSITRDKSESHPANIPLKNIPVRKIADTGDEPEFQKTEHIDAGGGLHKTPAGPERKVINAEAQTAVMDATPPPTAGSRETPQAHQDVPRPSAHEVEPPAPVIIPRQTSSIDLSASPLSGGGGDRERITHLGRYQIVEAIGKGAMGTVFRGVDPVINRPVALKTIRLDFVADQSELAELRDRLTREARAAGNLSHPNIVTIYDIGAEENLQYIAMEYLEGQTLEDLTKRKVQFSYRIVAGIISQICAALQYAHEQGIVHRDIKPANIMVLPDYAVKVMDFGIARVDSSSMTRTGIAMGTPNYIAPELLQGKPVDRRCDIFSLGVVIYELLTGRRPFRGENLTSLIYSIINENPPAPSTINDNVPLLFDHIVDKALRKNPMERFQKAADLKAALADFVGSFTGAKKVGL